MQIMIYLYIKNKLFDIVKQKLSKVLHLNWFTLLLRKYICILLYLKSLLQTIALYSFHFSWFTYLKSASYMITRTMENGKGSFILFLFIDWIIPTSKKKDGQLANVCGT